MVKVFFSFLSGFIFVLAAGCGKDVTVEEYQREKLRQNLAVYEAVAGRYVGPVTSLKDNSSLGAMEVQLRAEIQPNNQNGSDPALGSPLLVTNVRFLSSSIISLSAHNSFYDPSTGAFNAQIKVVRNDASSEELITVNGTLTKSAFKGEISAMDYPGAGGGFILEKNGPDLSTYKTDKGSKGGGSSNEFRVNNYSGLTNFVAGVKKSVQVVLLQPIHGTAEDILDLLTPVKVIQASFNYSRTLNILYTGAYLDTRQGLLTGKTSLVVNGQSQQMSLECHLSDVDIACDHLTTGGGIAAQTKAEVDANPPIDLPMDPDGREPVGKTFAGRGTIGEETGRMTLAVTQPSQGRLNDLLELFFPNSEKLVNVAVTFIKDVTTSFMGAKWDSVNGQLDGSMSSGGADPFIAYIQCKDFYFTTTNKPFKCTYWTSRSPIISIDFRPPFH